MLALTDEGFTDEDVVNLRHQAHGTAGEPNSPSVLEREELAFQIMVSLPRSSLAVLHRRIAPLLQLDIVGLLPNEIAFQVFGYLTYQTLLTCSLVSRRWNALANDQSLWKELCAARGWGWRSPRPAHVFESVAGPSTPGAVDSDDEGMGDEEDADDPMDVDDSGFVSMTVSAHHTAPTLNIPPYSPPPSSTSRRPRASPTRHSAPSVLPSASPARPDYKRLHQTHIRLRNRILSNSYTLSNLQTRGTPGGHVNTIYCLQLYTYPETGMQVIFTGSKDKSIREWSLEKGHPIQIIHGVHDSSVLSLCAHNGHLASAGSDRQVAVWDLAKYKLLRVISEHEDSVLCVRFDDKRLVSCSKDRTVRTYLFPDLRPHLVLGAHRAAVNAVSIAGDHIISASGDRSMRLWDANTGALLRTFENHHCRGIASIDFNPPFVLSGSSDKNLRLIDILTLQGWSTSPQAENKPAVDARDAVCESCGSATPGSGKKAKGPARQRAHDDLVRSVALSDDFVVSGSYDFTVKVWDRQTGTLVADLAGGHTGRVFCVCFDITKIVSCGEDQRICIWDFSRGLDTSFLEL